MGREFATDIAVDGTLTVNGVEVDPKNVADMLYFIALELADLKFLLMEAFG